MLIAPKPMYSASKESAIYNFRGSKHSATYLDEPNQWFSTLVK